MHLCEACARFARAISQNALIKNDYYNETIEVLRQQQECSFCTWLLSSAVYKDLEDDIYPTLYSIISENEESFDADEHYITYWFCAQYHNCHFTIRTPSGKYECLMFLSAEAGSAAAACGWPLASELRPPEDRSRDGHIAFVRLSLDTCFSEHSDCRNTISGEAIDEAIGPELPKRVLQIRAGPAIPMIKLLEPGKRRARYVALSHCWGPPEKQPLRTNKDNFLSHLRGISLESMPQTFRDAVELTYGLGIQYLWIDSLCIIQDDQQDWQNEAAEMGTIFENASLTIGAAAAEDSTQGLFAPIRCRQARVGIPYSTDGDGLRQSFQERLLVEEYFDCSPYWGPLRRRGWVLQERYLSRRQVFFTRGGLAWKCRNRCLDQFGEEIDDLQRTQWHSILAGYSRCRLTYASDRLIALEGLVRRQKKTRHDDYSFGVWHARAVLHILWSRVTFGPSSDDLSYLPSWSWAARSGEKSFWAHGSLIEDDVHTHWHGADMMTITDSGLMAIREAPMMACRTRSRPDSYGERANLRLAERAFPEQRLEPLAYIYTLRGDAMILVGIAALDEERSCHPSRCISLMRWKTVDWILDLWRDDIDLGARERHEVESTHEPDDEEEIESLHESEDVSEHDEDESDRERMSDGALNCLENNTEVSGDASGDEYGGDITDSSDMEEEDEYWHIVLMLEPVADRADYFRRVGMGIIPESYWKKADITYQEVNLV